MRRRAGVTSVIIFMTLSVAAGVVAIAPSSGAANTGSILNYQDINPKLAFNNTGAGGGGRVNGLAGSNDGNTYYAASEWGGLYKSFDGGNTWSWLTGHKPTTTWDVALHPTSNQTVYATSWFDGRVASRSLSGIQISRDGGNRWFHPRRSGVTPACATPGITNEDSGFGIAVDRTFPTDVYIGTNCGLAVSNNSGVTWSWLNPRARQNPVLVTGTAPVPYIYDVVAGGGIVDVCGDDGHWRSVDRGATWSRPAVSPTTNTLLPGTPAGRICSITASPDERHVMYAFVWPTIYETVDGGRNWRVLDGNVTNNPSPQGRIPFLTTNNRTIGFDLWFGDVSLHRRNCVTPIVVSQTPRCPPRPGGSDGVNNDLDAQTDELDEGWFGSAGDGGGFTRTAGAHDDAGDLIFNPTATNNACPKLFSSDGGIYKAVGTTTPGCHNPTFSEVTRPPHAWWIYTIAASDRAGDQEDLFVGLQDNGMWLHNTMGGILPESNWLGPAVCCDVFHIATDGARAVYTFTAGGLNSLQVCQRTATAAGGCGQVQLQPPGFLRGFSPIPSVAHFGGEGGFLVASTLGMFASPDLNDPPATGPSVWQPVGNNPSATGFCGVEVANPNSFGLTIYAAGPVPNCNKEDTKSIWRIRPLAEQSWTRLTGPTNFGSFGFVGVDPSNSQRLYAVWLVGPANSATPFMIFSNNSGSTWEFDPDLDAALLGDHLRSGVTEFVARSQTQNRGFAPFSPVLPYFQPSLIEFHPTDPSVIVVGGQDAGLIISTNSGLDWVPLRNPIPAPSTLPNPFHAYFDLEPGLAPSLIVGTQGAGVWRINLARADLTIDQLDPSAPIETGGVTTYTRTVRNPLNATVDEVTIFQQLPPGVKFEAAFSSPTCLLGTDGAVRCRIGRLGPGASSSLAIGLSAIDDGNQSENCSNHAVAGRVYSNAVDANPASNLDSTILTVCR